MTAEVLEPVARGTRIALGKSARARVKRTGWTSEGGRDYYVRQLRDMKGVPDLEDMGDEQLTDFARFCGRTLAAAHGRSGHAAGIAGYLGKSDVFDHALVDFALAYADRATADHRTFVEAIAAGRVETKEA